MLQAGARAERRADPGQGPDRPRLRRPRLLGHRDLRAAGADLHRARGRRRRAALAPRHAADQARERARQLGLAGRGVPVAHDRRRGVLGLLAGGHRGLPHQRRHRRRGRPLRRRDRRRRRSSATSGSSCWSRRRGCGARSATTTPTGSFRIDGVTGPDEYSAHRRQQRLHQPDGAAEPARRGRRVPSATRDEAPAARRRRRGDGGLARRRRRRCSSPTTSDLGVHPQAEGFTEHAGLGLRRTPAPSSTRCCCTSPTSTSTASRSSSRPTWCWRCTCAATRSPPSRRRATSTTTSALTVRDSSLSACTQAVHRRRGRPPRPGLRLPRAGRAHGPRRPGAQHPRRPAHRLAGRRLDRPRGRLRRHARPRRPADLRPAPAQRAAPAGLPRRVATSPDQGRGPGPPATYTLLRGEAVDLVHHGEEFGLLPDAPERKRIPPPPHTEPVQHPPHRAPPRRGGRT